MAKFIKNLIVFVCLITVAFTVGHFALAQGSSDNLLFGGLQNETGNIIGLGDEDPRVIIANIIRVALGFLGIVAVVLIMYAGWIWMTADGNAENIEKAKKILTGAVIGLVIILMSFAIATYILGKLLDATGGGGAGEACAIEGEIRNCGCGGTQTCASGTWGLCVGSTCGSDLSPFYITSTSPSNFASNEIRNKKIIFTFYSTVDSGTVSLGAGGTFRVTDASGAEIAGSQTTNGRRISFTPSGACPDNPCGAANCLPENEEITVTAVNGASGILSAGGKEIDCSSFGTLPCNITFNTGDTIDCEDPTVKLDLNLDQVCVAPDNKLYANSSDDSGVESIEFFVNNISVIDVPFGNNPIVNPNNDSPFNTRGEGLPSNWDGSSYSVGDSINVKAIAYDLDNHSASDSKDIALRPEHCCNGIKDVDEDGEDCGGADCASCDGAPIIDWVAPEGGFCDNDPNIFCQKDSDCGTTCNKNTPNGAEGNLVTIGGRYFGDTAGTVEFSGNNGTSWTPAVLGGCAGSWQNDQIIVQVPALSSGAEKIIKVIASNDFEDATDDGRGPIIDFRINNIKRPGVCSISPDEGIMNQKITYSNGLRLTGASAFFGNLSSSIAALNSSFSAADTGTADVPNIPTGKTTTFVKNNLGVPSNYLRFTKNTEPKIGPQITSFSPVKGKEGQYITIYGSGFGSANKDQVGASHNVYFDLNVGDNNNNNPENYGTKANFNFPDICSDSLWKDSQIIVKVPALSNDNYFIVIKAQSWDAPINTDGLTPDETFEYNNSLPLLPSLCKIAPAMGPNNSAVSLWGEYFGAAATAKVKFQLNKFPASLTINQEGGADRINTTVPGAAISGPVSVMQGSDEGNSLNFSVGNCSNESDCGDTVCCPAGSFRAGMCAVDDTGLGGNGDLVTNINDCYTDIGSSVYEWDFNTGPGGGPGEPCNRDAQTGACDLDDSGCQSDLICDADGVDNMTGNDDDCTCQPAGTCAGYSMNECTEDKFCPNSPGQCSPLAGGKTDVGDCNASKCNSVGCVSAQCEYNSSLNKCVDTAQTSCDLDIETTENLGGVEKKYNKYCAQYDNGTTVIDVWHIDTSASCPAGWSMISGGKCVDNINTGTCSLCDEGYDCLNNNGTGVCGIDKNICPSGSTCEAGECMEEQTGSCECCCNITAPAGQDCCIGLTCGGTCGADTNPDDSIGFGMCSGCADAGTTQDERDAACNCTGTTGKVCDTENAEFPTGVCVDGIPIGGDCSGSYCADTGFEACADDTNWCDPNQKCTCQPIGVGTPCDDDPLTVGTCELSTICEDSVIPGLYCDDVTCTCQQRGNDIGEECKAPDSDPPVCDPNVCKSGLACFTEGSDCGTCCCEIEDKNTPEIEDNCSAINPSLFCHYAEDADGCTDPTPETEPLFGLCCGCSSDGQCGGDVSATGCGSDTCCRPRPEIVSVAPLDAAENICRNAAIEATFDKKMDIKSFSGNVVVVGDYGFGVCPEGTQYILAKNENKGFFAKLLDAPVRLVKKIFYLLNPEARALTVNFCAIPGKVSGLHNADDTTTLTFTPNGLFDGNREYYVIIKGDSDINNNIDEGVKDIYGVSMADVWPDIDGGGLSESDRTFNGTVYHGYAWSFKTMSALNKNNGICKIDHAVISPESYLFSTTEDDLKENDADSGSSDFDKKQDRDKVFYAAAVSADGQILSKIPDVYTWSWGWMVEPNIVVDFDSENPFASVDAKQLFAAQDGVTDGKAVITATAEVSGSMAGDSEFYSAQADVWVFICENPWPSVVGGLWAPWSDASGNCAAFPGAQCPNTNYNIYYCRDAAGTGTVDDLPAILSKSTIIRGKSTDNKILKEFYFFREAAPTVSSGINLRATNISTTTNGIVALSWNAPAGGANGYKIYYGTSSGNYDFYIDVGNISSKEISGLTLNKNYYFSVTAYFNTGAESGYSSEVNIEVKDLGAPSAPTGLNIEKACDGEAVISWNANIEDTVGYKVFYGSVQAGQYGSSADVKDATGATLKGLNNGIKYYLAVKAYDSSGNESADSDEAVFTVIDSSSGQCFNFDGSLVLWQTFDSADISGNIVKDKSGKGNDGQIFEATSISGKVGQAMNFDGTNDYIQMADSDELDVTSDFTISMWFKRGRTGVNENLYSKNGPQTKGALTLGVSPNNTLYAVVQLEEVILLHNTQITDQDWHHVVLTRNSNNDWIIYLDGNEDMKTNNVNIPVANSSGLGIGAETPPTIWPYKGAIDEVMLYNKALSAEEINSLYQSYQ